MPTLTQGHIRAMKDIVHAQFLPKLQCHVRLLHPLSASQYAYSAIPADQPVILTGQAQLFLFFTAAASGAESMSIFSVFEWCTATLSAWKARDLSVYTSRPAR